MNILGLCSYLVESAATCYRLNQFFSLTDIAAKRYQEIYGILLNK